MRSTFARSHAITMDVVFMSTWRSTIRSESVDELPDQRADVRRPEQRLDDAAVSRSRSSRSVSSRSSFRAFCGDPASSGRASPRGRDAGPRAPSSRRDPGSPASGVRRSWETACRNVFFISSTARSRCAASRSTVRSRSSSWACMCSVMSISTPCQYFGAPSSSTMRRAWSWIHTVRPSLAISRYVASWTPADSGACAARSTSSGCTSLSNRSSSSYQSCGRVSEDLRRLRAHVQRVRRSSDRVEVRDRRRLLHEGAIPRFGLGQARLGLPPGGDVGHDALPILGFSVLVAHQDRLVPDPDHAARRS